MWKDSKLSSPKGACIHLINPHCCTPSYTCSSLGESILLAHFMTLLSECLCTSTDLSRESAWGSIKASALKVLHFQWCSMLQALAHKGKQCTAQVGTPGSLWSGRSLGTNRNFPWSCLKKQGVGVPEHAAPAQKLPVAVLAEGSIRHELRLLVCGDWRHSAHKNSSSSSHYLATNGKSSQTKPSSITFIWCYNR